MSVTIHKDYKGWQQMTVSYQAQEGVIGMRIPKIKTDLVLKWRGQRNQIMIKLQKIKAETMSLPRTKDGRIYKRKLDAYNQLMKRYKYLSDEMVRIDYKYWSNRRREEVMNHEPVFQLLFSLWSRYDEITEVAS